MARVDCDLCVIGAGSGGLSIAAAAAAFGVKVVLIERGKMGGDCLNTGCVPSKALIAAAHHAHSARRAGEFGIKVEGVAVDFQRVHRHVQEVIAHIAPVDSQERFEGLGVTVLRETASFAAPDRVKAGEHDIKARRFIIATGSGPAIPPISGIDTVPYLTNESLFELTTLPARLLVLGAGPIGCEMAQAFQRLGSQVTIIEMARPLARDDEEAAGVVVDALRQDGVQFETGARATAVKKTDDGLSLSLSFADGATKEIVGSHLLIAAGRRPTVGGLGLEAGNIAYDKHGIMVDEGLRSISNRRVYAVGDVAGGAQFTHAANYQAGLVIRNALFRLPVKVKADAIPWVTYTDPELAQIGLTEAAARQKFGDIRVMKAEFSHNDRSIAERTTAGFLKVVTSPKGKIFGATIVGQGAGELAGQWQFALNQGTPLRSLANVIFPYPTRAEISRRAAIAYFSRSLGSPWLRALISLLRRFG